MTCATQENGKINPQTVKIIFSLPDLRRNLLVNIIRVLPSIESNVLQRMLLWKSLSRSERCMHTLCIVSRWYRLKENIGLIYSCTIEARKYQLRLYTRINFPNTHNLKYANIPFELSGTVNILPFFSVGRSLLYLDRFDATLLLTTVSALFEVNFF